MKVEVGERQAAIDLEVIVEYGVSIPDLADGVRRSVIGAVEQMCGLEVTEVNSPSATFTCPARKPRRRPSHA